jgi:hypothetical protein
MKYVHTARGTKFPEHGASLNILLRSATVVVRPVLADSLCEATSVTVWITAQGLIRGLRTLRYAGDWGYDSALLATPSFMMAHTLFRR